MKKFVYKWLYNCLCIAIFMYIVDQIGILTHVVELDYNFFFHYPTENVPVSEIKNNSIKIQPLNIYNFSIIHNSYSKCNDSIEPRLTIIIKSEISNVNRRFHIRRTWGKETRFSDVTIKRVFALGSRLNDKALMMAIDEEANTNKDIIQYDFLDAYFNNTIKTMLGMRWAKDFCPKSQYFFFVDDDYYVSIKNLLRFIAHPQQYPEYYNKLKEMEHTYLRKPNYIDTEKDLFAGFVFQTKPHRHKFSKWYVPLSEYPFNLWPPYVTAGSFLISQNTLFKLYMTSLYTKHFRFDDIFLGIVALKANVALTHNDMFYFRRPKYNGPYSYKFVIAAHGFGNPIEMENVWKECQSAGFA